MTCANLRMTIALEAIALAMSIISILFCQRRQQERILKPSPLQLVRNQNNRGTEVKMANDKSAEMDYN